MIVGHEIERHMHKAEQNTETTEVPVDYSLYYTYADVEKVVGYLADTKAESARTPSPAPGGTRPCPAGRSDAARRRARRSRPPESPRRDRDCPHADAGPASKPAPRPLPS